MADGQIPVRHFVFEKAEKFRQEGICGKPMKNFLQEPPSMASKRGILHGNGTRRRSAGES